jgi:hypothetical protein
MNQLCTLLTRTIYQLQTKILLSGFFKKKETVMFVPMFSSTVELQYRSRHTLSCISHSIRKIIALLISLRKSSKISDDKQNKST